MKNIDFAIIKFVLLFAVTLSLPVNAQRIWHKVATNNCGDMSQNSFCVRGENYTFPNSLGGSSIANSCTFGNSIIFAFDKMNIHADYQLEALFFSDVNRTVRLLADGNEIIAVELKPAQEKRIRIDLPRKAYAYSQLVLLIDATKGPNAVISELNIYSSDAATLQPFLGDAREALMNISAFTVDTTFNVEDVIPTYVPKPSSVKGVYQPTISLNGTWNFNGNPINVPGQWSMQGYSVDSAAYGLYEKEFLLPADWSNSQIILRFDAVFSECTLLINDKEVGSHLGGLTAFEYDITSYLNLSTMNKIKLRVKSESLADMLGSLTQYAAHQLGGITRKVTLMALPKTHLSDVRIETSFDDTYTDAELKVKVSVRNSSDIIKKNMSVRLTVNGLPIVFSEEIDKIAANEIWTGVLSGIVEAPLKWDNEQPNLYDLSLELLEDGSTVETIEKRFGFREVEIKGNQLLVNGKAIKLRGVCRHEAHPLTGRVLSTDLQREDALLYRSANCNFIRTSHYPPSEEFIAICDELGLFVEVEAPICWIGHHANENWQKLNYQDSKYYPYVLQANMETIHFYRNNPSVIFWSMANESYWNREFAQVLEYMKKADTTRPNAFHDQGYGGFNNQGSTASIGNIHYPGPDGYKNPAVANSTRPMVYGEYCHLNVYNRSELVTDPGVRSDWALALAPTWENMYITQAVLGGSIWSGIDDVFQLPNGDAVGYGPWGPIDGWRRPKPEYWDMKKIYSPIRLLTTHLDPSLRFMIELENRYTYLNTNSLQIKWKYGKESGVASAHIEPGTKGRFSIEIQNPNEANELYLEFIDPRGFVADQFLLPVGRQIQNELSTLTPQSTRLKTTSEKFEVIGSGFYCAVSRRTGRILEVSKMGRILLTEGPSLMALPLDGGGCYPNHNANTPIFNHDCSEWKANEVKAEKLGESVLITVRGSYKEFEGGYSLLVNSNGELIVDYNFTALEEVNPRQWGLVFGTTLKFDETFWRRDAMWSVYPEDHISRPSGVAKLYYDNLPTTINPRVKPTWAWNRDFNELGSNDFRSTRRNVWFAGLRNDLGDSVLVDAKGKQHWRSWKAGNQIRFLVADFVTAGYEMFLGSYYAPFRKPIKVGESINGCTILRVDAK